MLPVCRVPAVFVLCLAATSACTQAQRPPAPETAVARLTGAELLERPITVLDYALQRIHDQLTDDVSAISEMHLWRGSTVRGVEMPTDVTAMAFASDSARVVIGYDVSTGKLTQPAGEVCRTLAWFVSNTTAADSVTRRTRWARDNVLSHFMPGVTAALAGPEARSRANDELQRRMLITIMIYEHSTRRSTKCQRQALSDSMTVEERPVAG